MADAGGGKTLTEKGKRWKGKGITEARTGGTGSSTQLQRKPSLQTDPETWGRMTVNYNL